jgi:hypothetical protein
MTSKYFQGAVLLTALFAGSQAGAAVSAAEAARLKGDLTPLGGEKAGNKDGTIPAWSGGMTTPTPGFKNGGRRPDPFADEKPLFQITAKNMDQHADKLNEGTKALLKRYPESYRLDVYKTHRTAAAPQWMYDNTFKNATRASVAETAGGAITKGAFGGMPFPIPKSGAEVMLNAQVRWRGDSWTTLTQAVQMTADGKPVLIHRGRVDNLAPYYYKEGSAENFDGAYWMVRVNIMGPTIRAGEAVLGTLMLDENKTGSWVYLVGQRRVRKLPNACCDTPHSPSAGVITFDEVEVFNGKLERFDWKLVGKKEMYIPYNSNRVLLPQKDSEVAGPKHLNPDQVRWELHRVWVVEATLREGQRHTVAKSLYYVDEDSWWPVLADRWDSKGQLARMPFSIPVAMPDLPGQVGTAWGTYDLISGSYYVAELFNESAEQYKLVSPRLKEEAFTAESLGGEGVR